ncbi:Predicted signal transduction protein [gamma proteobacterium HdN1]|nr:Predicted signal transduction protein [gamma proteobacterium HdN1]
MFFDIYEDLRNNRLTLPSIPEVALKIRKLIDAGNSAATIAKAVTADPVIAAKLLRAANSPLFRGLREFTTCTQAIVRIGLKTTKQLVMTFTVKELFHAKRPSTRKHMADLWNHSIEIAAICYVLASKTRTVDPEQAMLAGLLHDIGAIPILAYAENYPHLQDSPAALAEAVREFRGEVGGIILQRWGFDEDMINAAREAENWQRDHTGEADLADFVIVAQYYHLLVQGQGEALPALNAVPAMQRVLPGEPDAEKSLALLQEAHEQVVEVRHMLAG